MSNHRICLKHTIPLIKSFSGKKSFSDASELIIKSSFFLFEKKIQYVSNGSPVCQVNELPNSLMWQRDKCLHPPIQLYRPILSYTMILGTVDMTGFLCECCYTKAFLNKPVCLSFPYYSSEQWLIWKSLKGRMYVCSEHPREWREQIGPNLIYRWKRTVCLSLESN